MRAVSQIYKDEMAKLIQPPSYARCVFAAIDPHISEDVSFSGTAQIFYSDVELVGDAIHTQHNYVTFENQYFRVDGRGQLLPSNSSQIDRNAYVSAPMSGSDGSFSVPPSITAVLSQPYDISGVTVTFDTLYQNYATRMTVELFDQDGNLLEARECAPTSYVHSETMLVDGCAKAVFSFLSTNVPGQRLRVNEIVMGASVIFGADKIQKMTQDWSFDPVSSRLPTTKLSVTAENFDNLYNPDEPTGLYEKFDAMQPVDVFYGVDLDGAVEWLSAGRWYTTGAPATSGKYVVLGATDMLSHLTQNYTYGVYRPAGATLYDLAVEVLESCDLPLTADKTEMWVLDDYLKTITTTAPLPVRPVRECLQLIANAGECVLFTNNDGKIQMKHQVDFRTSVSASGQAYWSSVQAAIDQASNIAQDYITFSPGAWPVSDTSGKILLPSNGENFVPQGYVGAELSDENGNFSQPPVITLNFTPATSFYRISFTFDTINNLWATAFTVKFYNGDTLLDTITVTDNNSTYYTQDFTVENVTSLQAEFTAVNKPGYRLKIERLNDGVVGDFYLTLGSDYVDPPATKELVLSQMEVERYSYEPAAESSNIFTDEFELDGDTEIELSYGIGTGLSVSVSNGTIVSQELYGQWGTIVVNGTGETTVTVTGTSVAAKKNTVVIKKNDTGEPCPLDNPLITTTADAKRLGEWVANYLSFRTSYQMNFREDFKLEQNDVIYAQSLFDKQFPARITKLQFTVPGQKGTIQVRRLK